MTAPRPLGRTVPGNRWDLLDSVWPAEPPTVSVIVLHYDQHDELTRTAHALNAQTHPASCTEVIVVDDGSPRSPSVPPGWTLLVQENLGERLGPARNLGAAHASGDVLCFLDADTAPEPDYLRRLIRLPALAPETIAVGRRRYGDFTGVPPDAPIREGVATTLSDPQWLLDGYERTANLLAADDRAYRFVIGSVLACTRWFFRETGGFADFEGYGGEDWEWAHRAWRAGAIFAHVPDAVAWHDGPDWGARGTEEQRRPVKNRETLRLIDRIGVGGSSGHALLGWRSEVVIRIEADATAAATFVCVDSLLEAHPGALVLVADRHADLFRGDGRVIARSSAPLERLAWPQLEIDVKRPVRVDPQEFQAACQALLDSEATQLTARDGDGELAVVRDSRATRRARRWGGCAVDLAAGTATPWARVVPPEPDLEAYVGGWESSPRCDAGGVGAPGST